MPPRNPPQIAIEFKALTTAYGYAYADERRIELKKGMRPELLLKTAIHEVIHVELPDLDETAVLRIERSVADVLKRLGFKKVKNDANADG